MRLGALDPDERAEAVLDVVEKFHPEIREYVDEHKSICWDSYRWSRGAFCSAYTIRILSAQRGGFILPESTVRSPRPGWKARSLRP
jgi:hypothetical protein